MAVLKDGDFELDGFVFSGNRDNPVYVRSFTPGGATTRAQDASSPVGDQMFFGRDYLTPGQWVFGLRIRQESVADSLTAFGGLAAKWAADNVRLTPGALSVLRYSIGGRVRRVYGRSRGITPNTDNLWVANIVDAEVIFDLESPWHYEDEQNSLVLNIVTASTGGVILPTTWPLMTQSGGERQGVITNTGDGPAPFSVRFNGPITDPYVLVSGQEIKLLTTIAYDRSITVDTRLMTATRSDGANMAGSLTRKTRLAEARIKPGPAEVVFGGIDPTGTSKATVSWRPVHHSL